MKIMMGSKGSLSNSFIPQPIEKKENLVMLTLVAMRSPTLE
jgi:hypothetical protein